MTTAYWCVLVAVLLPYLFTGIAKSGKYNNRRPRDSLEALDGWRKRAHWAQLNSFEAFAPFAAAVIIAQLAQAPQGTVDKLAIAFIVLRLIYGAFYLADIHVARTLTWTAAFGCVIALFVVAA